MQGDNTHERAQQVGSHAFSSYGHARTGGLRRRPRPRDTAVGRDVHRAQPSDVPEFDAKRVFRLEGDPTDKHRPKTWKIELEATRTIDVVTVLFTVQPGGHSGWHSHPGPALFTVSEGTLTMYDADDRSCTPHLFPTGSGSIEADTSTHNHWLRNETSSVAKTRVTFLRPVGAPIRTDQPDPGRCSF